MESAGVTDLQIFGNLEIDSNLNMYELYSAVVEPPICKLPISLLAYHPDIDSNDITSQSWTCFKCWYDQVLYWH